MIAQWSGKACGVNRRLAKGRGGRFFATKDYKDFIDSLAWALRAAYTGTYSSRVDVRLSVCLWDRRDTDSVIKPCLDALERAGVVADDGQVRHLTVLRDYHGKGELDTITVYVTEAAERTA